RPPDTRTGGADRHSPYRWTPLPETISPPKIMRNITAAIIGPQSSSGCHGSGHRLEWRALPRPSRFRSIIVRQTSRVSPSSARSRLGPQQKTPLPRSRGDFEEGFYANGGNL